MMRRTRYGILLALWGVITSCTGELFVEKSQTHSMETRKIKKVVSIDPTYELLDRREAEEDRYLQSGARKSEFIDLLKDNARQCRIQLQIEDGDQLRRDDVSYFNELMPLRQQIFMSNFMQEVELRKGDKSFLFGEMYKPSNYIFKDNPVLDSQFSYLAKKYKTPYFALHGVISSVQPHPFRWVWTFMFLPLGIYQHLRPKHQTMYYAILVNVESSEVIYRELRTVEEAASKSNLNGIVYDSFRILKKR